MFSSVRNVTKSLPKVIAAPRLLQREIIPSSYLQRKMISCNGKCVGCTTCSSAKRSITTNTNDSSKLAVKEAFNAEFNGLYSVPKMSASAIGTRISSRNLEINFSDGDTTKFPLVWLRDNCQCNSCFHPNSLGRSFLMNNLELDVQVSSVNITNGNDIEIIWEDGHTSNYTARWLHERSFSESARQRYRNIFNLPKKLWTKGFEVPKFDYSAVMEDEQELLRWLVTQETYGATLLQNTPAEPPAAFNLAERTAKAKYTHFGDYSNVINHPQTNNLAYTNYKLNLHNDMPQYMEIPGLIFLHMIKQATGNGGDTVISDGFNAAEQMRQDYPELFELLCETDVYFWDKGDGKDKLEMQQFYKINKGPTIQTDNRGNITTIRFNNQVRDSHLDLPREKVTDFYRALKIYFDLMYDNSISYKMQNGEMTILDNVRCQHGREAFEGDDSARHLVTTFMAWDEALCRRRRLQEKFNIFN